MKIIDNFDVKANIPIDKRMVIENLNDLILPYQGMLTFNKSDKRYYGFIDGTYKDILKDIEDSINLLTNNVGSTLNVKDYGVKGNGTTDDTNAINIMFSTLDSYKLTTIIFPQGTYIVSSTIKIPSNVIIKGVGDKSIIKVKNNITTNTINTLFWCDIGIKNVYIKDLFFDGNGTNQSGTNLNIILVGGYKCSNVTVENCSFINNYGTSIDFSNSKFIKINNNIVDKTFKDDGIVLVADISDSNNYFIANSIITNNIVKNTFADGIGISGNAENNVYIQHVIVSNNSFYNCGFMDNNVDGAAIYVVFGKMVILSDNDINTVGGNGIDVASSLNININDNLVEKSGRAGIMLDSTNYSQISDNICINNVQKLHTDSFNANNGYIAGIALKTYNNHITINDNICTDNQNTKTQKSGITFYGNTNTYCTVNGNDISGNIDSLGFYSPQPLLNCKIINNMGYNPRGFSIGNKPLPNGLGENNKVGNTEPTPVIVYISDGAGTALIDVNGTPHLIGDVAKTVILQPQEYIYFNDSLPSGWAWYGL